MADNKLELEMLEKAGAFEELIRTKGWEYIKNYIEEQIKDFANISIINGYKSIEDFNFARGQIVALRQILVEIESQLRNLNNYREQHNIK
jgi:hypothetical protein